MLLICPVRPGDRNEELRYAIRSWERYLRLDTPLELMVVGYCPKWLEPDHFVEGNAFTSTPLAVFDNIVRGSQAAVELGAKDAVYMNDDFFCLDPVTRVVPVKRNVDLRTHLANVGGGRGGLWWPTSLDLTASWLDTQGFPNPDSYEVHRPLPAAPADMLWALDQWGPADKGDTVPQWRTTYGVLNKVEAIAVRDVKLSQRITGFGCAWISTDDASWRLHRAKIAKHFSEPSRWERDSH